MTLQEKIDTVYIHIPFCLKKCNYCDFFSVADPGKMTNYVDALIKEIALAKRTYCIEAKTIFIGGGTPTCLPETLLEELLAAVNHMLVGPELQEYTIEANPGTINLRKLQMMTQYGVNRISFGVQSSRKKQLEFLGRIHSFEDAKEAVDLARKAGIENINLDFIYGIPEQTLEEWEQTLEQGLALAPEHLSLYQLKIEEGTVFAKLLEEGSISEFDDEIALMMYRKGQDYLSKNGFHQYEISNYARDDRESRHNKAYWNTKNYIGLGTSACSWIKPERWTNTSDFEKYSEMINKGSFPKEEIEMLSLNEQMEEFAFMSLRMNEGFSKTLFEKRFSKNPEEVFQTAIHDCKENGWLEETEDYYRLTEDGRVLGNLVFMEFLLEEDAE